MLARFLNALFSAALTGLVVMLAARCYLPLVPSVAIGSITALGLFAVLLLLGGKNHRKSALKKRESDLRSALLVMTPDQRRRFLFDALGTHAPCTPEGDDAARISTPDGEVVLLERIRYETLSGDEVVAARTRFQNDALYIFCDAYDKGAADASAILDVKLVHGACFKEILDRLRAYPKIPKRPDKRKRDRMRIVKTALHPSRFKGYLLTAFVLATSGFLTPYRIYYLVFATLACALAAVSLVDVFHAREHSA